MKHNSDISQAVRRALFMGTLATTMSSMPLLAQDQDQDQDQDQADDVQTVVVTGSRIRRVDLETASPVYTLDRSSIESSGVVTLGDLVQSVPSVAGAATNPQVNNGGGTGASHIELRGLGTARTLVLLNGRRLGGLAQFSGAVDINAIPMNLIERVEVLKEGAGAIYGSDAIGGVVNFITRQDFEGFETGLDFGLSGEDDGERKAVNLSWGTSSDRGNVILGANYQQQDAISANDRDFARNAIYFYGSVFEGGSSRAPNGRISAPGPGGCTSVIRVEGTTGASPADYRCFVTTGGDADFFNFQPLNLVLTPQERGSVFTSANFDLHESVEIYADVVHNYTTSGFQIAPLPFDARSDQVIIPTNNVFNPFGIAFGGQTEPLNPNALWRMEALGNRTSNVDATSDELALGFRGAIGRSDWTYDSYVSYSRLDQDTTVSGYMLKPLLADAFGPNFIDGTGNVVCGTPAEPIPGCTPVNIFNLDDPAQIAALRQISSGYGTDYTYTTKIAAATFTGDVIEMPAGPLQLAVGAEYREQEGRFDTDSITEALPPLFNVCQLASETCSGDSGGKFDVSEIYAELFFPVLKDAPGAHALNLTLGTRYSDYSTFGDTTNSVFKVEYRPVEDLLVRGSFAEVFRAPTVNDLFGAPTADAATFNDPCVGLTQAVVDANPNFALACANVPRDGSFEQPNSQVDGLLIGNATLVPEVGEVLTYGIVYDPSWLNGLSLSVDFWDYQLDEVINQIDVNTTAEQCVALGTPQFCGLMARFSDGQIQQIQEPALNLGTLETTGVDLGIKYRVRDTRIGGFNISLDMTYIDKYDNVPAPGAAPVEVAGTFDRQYGNLAQWRGLAGFGWAYGGFNSLIVTRYIHSLELVDPDGAPGIQDSLQVGSHTYVDVTLGYTFKENTKFQLGANNLTDKQPPILFQNNVLNANTDVSTYDTIGRYYFVTLSHRF
jgi:iron complex outermembrane recepter protein